MSLVKILTSACVLLAMLIMVGCSSGGSSSTTIVRGVVKDSTTNTALMGVTVSAGTSIATTDVNGKFSLSVAPGSNIKIKAVKTGYVDVIEICGVSDGGTAEVDLSLDSIGYEKNLTQMINTQNVATDPRGTEVILAANSIVDSTNTPVDSAKIEVTTSMPNDINYTENFPGLFIGTGNPGAVGDTAIESFVFVTIEITSGGKDCNLAAGKEADIAIPVGAGTGDPGTNTIELWSLNDDTGKWIYEGLATRDNTVNPIVYRAKVKHFSTYNLDRPISSAMPLTVTVLNGTTPIAGASVVAKTQAAPGWEGRGITGANGKYKFSSVSPGTNSIVATFGSLRGAVYGYDIVGGEAFATITVQETTSKEVTFFYMDGGVKKPAVGANVNIFAQGTGTGGGGGDAWGVTDANGKYTFALITGLPTYMLNGSLTIGPVAYSYNNAFNSIAAIPNEVELTKP
jgi:hypothetical protein